MQLVDATVQHEICLQALGPNVGSAAGTQLPGQHNLSQHCDQHFGMGWLHAWDAAAQEVCTAKGEEQASRLRCRCVVAMFSAPGMHRVFVSIQCPLQQVSSSICLPALRFQPACTGTGSCMLPTYASTELNCTHCCITPDC